MSQSSLLFEVEAKVHDLMRSGKIYYGQPTKELLKVMADAVKSCRAQVSAGGDPLEFFDKLCEEAQKSLYGHPKIRDEWAASHSSDDRYYLIRILSVTSVYRFPDVVWNWLAARRAAGLPDIVHKDRHDVSRQILLWDILQNSGIPAAEIEKMPNINRAIASKFTLKGEKLLSFLRRVDAAIDASFGFLLSLPAGALTDADAEEITRMDAGRANSVLILVLRGVAYAAAMDAVDRSVKGEKLQGSIPHKLFQVNDDTFEVCGLDGVFVPLVVIQSPETQRIEDIKNETNLELKRLRIERYAGADKPPIAGWQRYIAETDSKVIDSRRNDIEVTREVLLDNGDPWRVLLCTCKTGRLFALSVPKDIQSCESAQYWLSGERSGWMTEELPPIAVIGRS